VKLVETDIEIEREREPRAETITPPRPEHRKAYVSLLVTGAVLVATVAAVYLLFPKRDHEVIDAVVAHHRDPGGFAMDHPSRPELVGWTIGALGRSVPWPDGADLRIEGLKKLVVLKKPAALVRYRIGGAPVTLAAMQSWDLTGQLVIDDGDLRAVWWRKKGPWTMIAVGPAATADAWRAAIGAPR
jgi:hypothetical protein